MCLCQCAAAFLLLNAVGRHEFSKEVAGLEMRWLSLQCSSSSKRAASFYCTNATNPHGPSVARVVFCPFVAQWQDNDPSYRRMNIDF